MRKWFKTRKSKYFWIALVVLVVFITIWVTKGVVAAAFWSAVAAALLLYLAFDPRLKRHW
jgi:hypothetical protein